MQTIFVTGASGFLANRLIEVLLDKGYAVKGQLRNVKHYRGIQHEHLSLVTCDLTDFETTKIHLLDCDIIIHAAAITRQDLLHAKDYESFNLHATMNLLACAKLTGIRKFIFISTANTQGHGTLNEPGTEWRTARQPFLSSLYASSKMKAQEAVLHGPGTFTRVIVAPTFMLGPGAIHRPSGEILRRSLFKKLILYPPGGKNFVHVDDVVRVIVAAMENAPDRSVWLAAGENCSYRDFFKKLIAISGQHSYLVSIPPWVMRLIGLMGDMVRRLGIRSNLSSVNMNILCTGNYYCAQKAEKEFGICFKEAEEILRDAIPKK